VTHTTRCALYADGYTQVIKRIKLQGLKRKEQEEALNEVRDTGTVRGTEADSRRITHTSHTHTRITSCAVTLSGGGVHPPLSPKSALRETLEP